MKVVERYMNFQFLLQMNVRVFCYIFHGYQIKLNNKNFLGIKC